MEKVCVCMYVEGVNEVFMNRKRDTVYPSKNSIGCTHPFHLDHEMKHTHTHIHTHAYMLKRTHTHSFTRTCMFAKRRTDRHTRHSSNTHTHTHTHTYTPI